MLLTVLLVLFDREFVLCDVCCVVFVVVCFVCLFVCLLVRLFVFLFHLVVCLCVSVYLFGCMFVWGSCWFALRCWVVRVPVAFVCLLARLFVCFCWPLVVYLFVLAWFLLRWCGLFVCVFACMSVYLLVRLIAVFVCSCFRSFVCLCVHLFGCLFVWLLAWLFVCLCVFVPVFVYLRVLFAWLCACLGVLL